MSPLLLLTSQGLTTTFLLINQSENTVYDVPMIRPTIEEYEIVTLAQKH